MKMVLRLLLPAAAITLSACTPDSNTRPEFGKETGLPANCRAYVQFAIDEFRARKYTAEETTIGLERNCGAAGALWGHRP